MRVCVCWPWPRFVTIENIAYMCTRVCVCSGLGHVGYCVCVVCYYNNLCVYLNCKLPWPWPRLVIYWQWPVCVCSCFGLGLVGYCVCCVLLYVFASMVSRHGLGWLYWQWPVCVCVCVCSCFGLGLVGYCVCCVLLYVFASSMVSRLGLGLGWLYWQWPVCVCVCVCVCVGFGRG